MHTLDFQGGTKQTAPRTRRRQADTRWGCGNPDDSQCMSIRIRPSWRRSIRCTCLFSFDLYQTCYDSPSTIVQACKSPSPNWVSHLRDITRSRNATKGDTKAQQESSSDEHRTIGRRCLNACPDDDYGCSCEHSCSSTKSIINRASEENSRDRTDVVNGEDNASR